MTQSSLEAARQQALREKHRQKRMLTKALALFALAGTIGGGTLYLEHARANQGTGPKTDASIPDMAPEKQVARMARAQEMREQWKSWAMQHKDDLQAMRKGDHAAFQRVVSALPENRREWAELGLRLGEIGEGPVPFSLGFMGSDLKNNFRPGLGTLEEQAKRRQRHERLLVGLARFQENNFSQFKDVVLLSSSNAGSKKVRVWASGRITEQAYVSNPERGAGLSAFVVEENERVPAFDFVN